VQVPSAFPRLPVRAAVAGVLGAVRAVRSAGPVRVLSGGSLCAPVVVGTALAVRSGTSSVSCTRHVRARRALATVADCVRMHRSLSFAGALVLVSPTRSFVRAVERGTVQDLHVHVLARASSSAVLVAVPFWVSSDTRTSLRYGFHHTGYSVV